MPESMSPGTTAPMNSSPTDCCARACEIILGCDDFSAEEAERLGWINRALPADEIGPYVDALARRIASFPALAIAGATDEAERLLERARTLSPEDPRVHRNEGILRHNNHGIGASHLLHGLKHGLLQTLFHELGRQMQDDLRIHARLENGSTLLKFCPDLARIHQVAVVCDGQCFTRILDPEGLRVYEKR